MTRTRPAALRELKASHSAHGHSDGHQAGKPAHHGTKPKPEVRTHKAKHKLEKHKLHKRRTSTSTSTTPPSPGSRARPRRRWCPSTRRRPRPPRRPPSKPSSRSRRRGGCCGGPASARARAGRGARRTAGPTGRLQPHAAVGRGRAAGPRTAQRRRRSAAAGRRLGRRPLLVAGPHDPLRSAAGGADDLHLARLVRQLQRKGQRPAAHARPEQPVPRTGAGQLPRPVPRRHREPGDARVPRRHLQQPLGTERELRARDDGAVLARRRPRRLHRGRRQRDGPHADRVDGRMDRKQRAAELPLRSRTPRPGPQDGVRPDRQLELRRRGARCACTHPLHPSYFVSRLWSYFVPAPPPEATLASLEGVYVSSGYSIRAVVEAILQSPEFLDGPELVTPPVVYNAGLLRAVGRYIDTTAWTWLSAAAGQQLFYPPNVSGWDFTRWLDTSTAKARWEMATYVTSNNYPNPWPGEGEPHYSETETAAAALASALAYWAQPALSEESLRCIARIRAELPGRGGHGRMAAEPLPRDPPERAADADRDLPRHAGELTTMQRAARAGSSRARSCCAPASRRPGAGCPRSSRGCRCRPAPA